MSLARGLDYYTGVIYEAVLTSFPPELINSETGKSTTTSILCMYSILILCIYM